MGFPRATEDSYRRLKKVFIRRSAARTARRGIGSDCADLVILQV
jgi:hypothetical protein